MAVFVSNNAAWGLVPSVADLSAEAIWREGEMVEQCVAELPDLAAVEIDNG